MSSFEDCMAKLDEINSLLATANRDVGGLRSAVDEWARDCHKTLAWSWWALAMCILFSTAIVVASVDGRPKGRDSVKHEARFTTSAVPKADAQTHPGPSQ